MLAAGDQATAQARAAVAAGRDIVAAAGGDGTINAVAQALVGSATSLGVVPFGTYNHFARDVHIPLQPAAAVDVLRSAMARPIDVGAVNDRFFINNASLGLYPELVQLRRETPSHGGRRRMQAAALWNLLRTAPPLPLAVEFGTSLVQGPMWLVFVGNNRYGQDIFRPVGRLRLDLARLDVAVVQAQDRQLLVRMLRSLRWSTQPGAMFRRDVDQLLVRPLEQASSSIAFDGEATVMPPPFVFRSVPHGLSVVTTQA